MKTRDAVALATQSFGHVLPFTVKPCVYSMSEFARMIREHSTAPQAQALADEIQTVDGTVTRVRHLLRAEYREAKL